MKIRALGPRAGPPPPVRSVCLGADGHCVLRARRDRTRRGWEVARRSWALREEPSGDVLPASLGPDGRWAGAGTYDGKVLVWELEWGS